MAVTVDYNLSVAIFCRDAAMCAVFYIERIHLKDKVIPRYI